MLNNSMVLITNEEGRIDTVIPEKEAGDDVQKLEGILSPGFVNCHCHLELSHLKGLIPEKTGLVDFVFRVVTQRHFPIDEISDAIAKAEEEMLQNGIVAVGDICNTASTLKQKSKYRLNYYNFIEAIGWLPQIAPERFERSLNLYNEFIFSLANSDSPESKIRNATETEHSTTIVPHAPYSVSEHLWKYIYPYFQNKVASIHNQETSFEDELFLQGGGDFTRMYKLMNIDNSFFKASGKSSLQTYFPKLKTAKNIILVHNTFTKEEDIQYAKAQSLENNQELFWCLCPNANLYIEDALPPVKLLRANNCKMVLGTDSLASNYSLNIVQEIKTITKYFPGISLSEILQWATFNGASALQFDNKLGSFEKGKKPGINLLKEDLSEIRKII
jgi:cytosine/adenosine deaminase-related metal-dependent hydrolase